MTRGSTQAGEPEPPKAKKVNCLRAGGSEKLVGRAFSTGRRAVTPAESGGLRASTPAEAGGVKERGRCWQGGLGCRLSACRGFVVAVRGCRPTRLRPPRAISFEAFGMVMGVAAEGGGALIAGGDGATLHRARRRPRRRPR